MLAPRITGSGGTFWRAYARVATLGEWALARADADTARLDAEVCWWHPLWAVPPYTVDLYLPNERAWRWRDVPGPADCPARVSVPLCGRPDSLRLRRRDDGTLSIRDA